MSNNNNFENSVRGRKSFLEPGGAEPLTAYKKRVRCWLFLSLLILLLTHYYFRKYLHTTSNQIISL